MQPVECPQKEGPKMAHLLDTETIDDCDAVDGDEQLLLIWCDTHAVFEWHWLPRDLVGPRYRNRSTEKQVF